MGVNMDIEMGLTHQRFVIRESRRSETSAQVDLLVDSGAIYSCIPSTILRNLSIEPNRDITLTLADGRRISRDVGDAFFEFRGICAPSPVMFGLEDDLPVLGVVTLETLELVLDPLTRRLHPMRMIMSSYR